MQRAQVPGTVKLVPRHNRRAGNKREGCSWHAEYAAGENKKVYNALSVAPSKDSRMLKLLRNGSHSIQRRIGDQFNLRFFVRGD